jgi:hypothetical protein
MTQCCRFPIDNHFQNIEHPNQVSNGWGFLHYVLNSVQDYQGIIRRFPWPQNADIFQQ